MGLLAQSEEKSLRESEGGSGGPDVGADDQNVVSLGDNKGKGQ